MVYGSIMLKIVLVTHLTYENQWGKLRTKVQTFGFGTHYCLTMYAWWTEEKGQLSETERQMRQIDRSWRESKCVGTFTGCPCKNDALPALLFLRGLCPSSLLKTKNPKLGLQFIPVQRPHDVRNVWFQGGMSSKIYHNDMKWTIDDDVWNVTATSNAAKYSYALGKHEWLIEGDDLNCHKGEPYTTLLKLTGCLDGDFTCDDGQCVRMEQRCDQLPNCADESDETGCRLLVLKDSYNKRVPPISAKSALDFTIVPVSVEVSIVLMSLMRPVAGCWC